MPSLPLVVRSVPVVTSSARGHQQRPRSSPVVIARGHRPRSSPVVITRGHRPRSSPAVIARGHHPWSSPVVITRGHHIIKTTQHDYWQEFGVIAHMLRCSEAKSMASSLYHSLIPFSIAHFAMSSPLRCPSAMHSNWNLTSSSNLLIRPSPNSYNLFNDSANTDVITTHACLVASFRWSITKALTLFCICFVILYSAVSKFTVELFLSASRRWLLFIHTSAGDS